MMRTVLWIAVAVVLLLAALALTRGFRFGPEPAATPAAPTQVVITPVAPEPVAPVPAAAPEPRPGPAPPPIDDQVAEDAAAVGMTTLEPSEEQAPEAPPPEPAAEQPPL